MLYAFFQGVYRALEGFPERRVYRVSEGLPEGVLRVLHMMSYEGLVVFGPQCYSLGVGV